MQRGIADKDLHKLIVRQLQELRATLMYILQSRFIASLTTAEVTYVDPTSRVVNMLNMLSKIDIEVFVPPVVDCSVAGSRQPEVHFHALTTA